MSSPEVNALQDLRKGSFYAIIANVLISIAVILVVGSLFTILFSFSSLASPYSSSSSPFSLFASVGSLAGILILEILALVFTVLSILRLRSGFRGLEAVGKDVGGVTGTTLWIIGVVLTIIGVGAILTLVGLILIGLAVRRVGQIYNISDIRNGGILIAIGSVIPFLAFIGFILTYVGLGKLLNTMGPGGQPPSGPGQGTAPTQ